MDCPYCKAPEADCVPDVVYRHAEAYGGGLRRFRCKKCGNVVQASVGVIVDIANPSKTDKESDW